MWHPQAAGPRDAARRGQGQRVPGHRLRPARREPLHQPPLLGGRASSTPTRARGWIGRYLDATGEPDNPLQGLSLDYSLAPALATAKMPVRGRQLARRLQHVGVRLRRTVSRRRRWIPSGSSARSARPRPPTRRRAAPSLDTSIVLDQMAPFVGPEGKPTYTSPVTYPAGGGEFPERLAALAAMLAAGLPIKCASLTARRLLRHPLRRGRHAEHEPRPDASNRCSPSSATSKRAASTTAC